MVVNGSDKLVEYRHKKGNYKKVLLCGRIVSVLKHIYVHHIEIMKRCRRFFIARFPPKNKHSNPTKQPNKTTQQQPSNNRFRTTITTIKQLHYHLIGKDNIKNVKINEYNQIMRQVMSRRRPRPRPRRPQKGRTRRRDDPERQMLTR